MPHPSAATGDGTHTNALSPKSTLKPKPRAVTPPAEKAKKSPTPAPHSTNLTRVLLITLRGVNRAVEHQREGCLEQGNRLGKQRQTWGREPTVREHRGWRAEPSPQGGKRDAAELGADSDQAPQ